MRGQKSRDCVKNCAPSAPMLMMQSYVWRESRARSKPKTHAAPLISGPQISGPRSVLVNYIYRHAGDVRLDA